MSSSSPSLIPRLLTQESLADDVGFCHCDNEKTRGLTIAKIVCIIPVRIELDILEVLDTATLHLILQVLCDMDVHSTAELEAALLVARLSCMYDPPAYSQYQLRCMPLGSLRRLHTMRLQELDYIEDVMAKFSTAGVSKPSITPHGVTKLARRQMLKLRHGMVQATILALFDNVKLNTFVSMV